MGRLWGMKSPKSRSTRRLLVVNVKALNISSKSLLWLIIQLNYNREIWFLAWHTNKIKLFVNPTTNWFFFFLINVKRITFVPYSTSMYWLQKQLLIKLAAAMAALQWSFEVQVTRLCGIWQETVWLRKGNSRFECRIF